MLVLVLVVAVDGLLMGSSCSRAKCKCNSRLVKCDMISLLLCLYPLL